MKFLIFVLFSAILVHLSSQACSSEFRRAFLAKHNQLRAKHGVPALIFDDYLQNRAQEWADRMADSGRISTRRESQYGENLYVSWSNNGAHPNADTLVQSWYDDIDNYATYFGAEPDMDSISLYGYFTQLIWRDSRRVGVGCGIRGNSLFVVANYDPAGNVNGRFQSNVPAPMNYNYDNNRRNFRRIYPSTSMTF